MISIIIKILKIINNKKNKKMISNIYYENELEKKNQLRKEMESNYRFEQALREEKEEEERKKREIIAREYDDYLKGQEHKHYKMLKSIQDKLEPTLVSLPLNSEERLRKWKENIERRSEKGEINGKLFNDFQKRSRATSHYNYLTKRYSLNNRVVPDYPSQSNNIDINDNINSNNYGNNYNNISNKEVYSNNLRNVDLNNINVGENIPIIPRYSSDILQYQQQANLNYLSKTPNVNNIKMNNLQITNPIDDKIITKDNNTFNNHQMKTITSINNLNAHNNNIYDKKIDRNIYESSNNHNLNRSYIKSEPIQRSYSNSNFYSGIQSKNPQFVFSSEGGKREGTDITNNAYFDHYYNDTYGSYKEINKQYEDYNKSLVAQNEKFKEEMLIRRKHQEEIRRLERERLAKLQQLQKMYDEDLKRQYRQYLDQQVVQQLPRKLMDEGYTKEALTENTNMFQNEYLYVNAPDYNLINKSKFVEVNPYNPKKYDLGETELNNNTILNPAFNYRFNKYIVPLDKEMRANENLLRNTGMNLVNSNNQ